MAFRGIDMQIMATKAQEVSADRARADRQHDVRVEQAALRGRERVEHDQQRTGKTARVEESKIRPDSQGQPGEYAQTERQEQNPSDEQNAAPGHELLDLPVERSEKTRKKTYTFDATV